MVGKSPEEEIGRYFNQAREQLDMDEALRDEADRQREHFFQSLIDAFNNDPAVQDMEAFISNEAVMHMLSLVWASWYPEQQARIREPHFVQIGKRRLPLSTIVQRRRFMTLDIPFPESSYDRKYPQDKSEVVRLLEQKFHGDWTLMLESLLNSLQIGYGGFATLLVSTDYAYGNELGYMQVRIARNDDQMLVRYIERLPISIPIDKIAYPSWCQVSTTRHPAVGVLDTNISFNAQSADEFCVRVAALLQLRDFKPKKKDDEEVED